MATEPPRIAFCLDGPVFEAGAVLGLFEAFRTLVVDITSAVANGETAVEWDICSISKQSPARLAMTPRALRRRGGQPRMDRRVSDVYEVCARMRSGADFSSIRGITPRGLAAARRLSLAAAGGASGFTQVRIEASTPSGEWRSFDFDSKLAAAIDAFRSASRCDIEQVEGVVRAASTYNDPYVILVSVSDQRRLNCRADEATVLEIAKHLNSRIWCEGAGRFDANGDVDGVDVAHWGIIAQRSATIPHLDEIIGIAPDSGMPSAALGKWLRGEIDDGE